jgi:hypothetical protein
MSVAERVWDALAAVLRMNDKVEQMSAVVATQQDKIERLTERVIRLETALELALVARRQTRSGPLLPRD